MKSHKNSLFIIPCLIGFTCLEAVADPMEMDERDRQVLAKLSSSDLTNFNNKLREAMALYYDNAYALSLPLFRDIAYRADTLDILYWYGSAAQNSGQTELAITKFLAILERHPELNQVRLDLALAYLQKGDQKSAAAEIQKVQNNNPSPEDMEKIALITQSPDTKDKRFFGTVRLSTGIQNDTNINAQPNDLIANLSPVKKHGFGSPMSASLDTMYDFGKKQGEAVWHNHFSLYKISNRDASEYDYFQSDLRTGLEHYGEIWQWKLPIGYIDRQFSHDPLSDSWYLAPEVGYMVRENLTLNFAYRFESENSDLNVAQDNVTNTLSLRPSWLFKNPSAGRTSIVSVQADYGNRDAEGSAYSYEDLGVGTSWLLHLDSGVETFLQARYLNRDYEGNTSSLPILSTPARREDQRISGTAMISRQFMDHYTLSASYAYTHNESNDQRFDYDKNVVGVNLGVNLNF